MRGEGFDDRLKLIEGGGQADFTCGDGVAGEDRIYLRDDEICAFGLGGEE